jgi:hypothetical protein
MMTSATRRIAARSRPSSSPHDQRRFEPRRAAALGTSQRNVSRRKIKDQRSSRDHLESKANIREVYRNAGLKLLARRFAEEAQMID